MVQLKSYQLIFWTCDELFFNNDADFRMFTKLASRPQK